MKGKKLTSKPKVQSPECRVCGLASEAEGKFCPSCAVMHQETIDLVVKRSVMIRYARMYFYDAVCLYRLWLIENRRQRMFKRAKIIAGWLDRNKRNKAVKRRYQDLHLRFVEFVESPFTLQAEKKVEEMFELLKKR